MRLKILSGEEVKRVVVVAGMSRWAPKAPARQPPELPASLGPCWAACIGPPVVMLVPAESDIVVSPIVMALSALTREFTGRPSDGPTPLPTGPDPTLEPLGLLRTDAPPPRSSKPPGMSEHPAGRLENR
jgi:hypothetical protein